MICDACHGQPSFPPCEECGGCGIAHCCDGLVECPSAGDPTSPEKPASDQSSRGARLQGNPPGRFSNSIVKSYE